MHIISKGRVRIQTPQLFTKKKKGNSYDKIYRHSKIIFYRAFYSKIIFYCALYQLKYFVNIIISVF